MLLASALLSVPGMMFATAISSRIATAVELNLAIALANQLLPATPAMLVVDTIALVITAILVYPVFRSALRAVNGR